MLVRLMVAAWLLVGCFPDPPAVDSVDEGVADADSSADDRDDSTATDETDAGAGSDVSVSDSDVTETSPDTADTEETAVEVEGEVVEVEAEVVEGDSGMVETEVAEVGDATDADTSDTADDTDADAIDADATPCPGGCAHLDDACHAGVCGERGCETTELTGPCDDADACTLDDHCEAGVCIGRAVVCEAIDTCHIAGLCQPDTGICTEPTKLDTAACDDGDACTEGEACSVGVCSQGRIPDDSDDWLVAISPVGTSAIVARDDGSAWWFVELLGATTELGRAQDGSLVSMVLPGSDTSGIAAVHYGADGIVLERFLVASTTAKAQLVPNAEHASVHRDVLGRDVVTVAFTFTGVVTLGSGDDTEVLDVTSGAPRAYVISRFLADGHSLNHWRIENPGFSDAFNLRDGVPPAIAVARDGRFGVSIVVASDVEAEIESLGSYRSPAGSVTAWTVAFSSSGTVLWQRLLVGESEVFGVYPYLASYSNDGSFILGGRLVGVAEWRRADTSEVIGQFGVPGVFSVFTARISTGADIERVAFFGGGPNSPAQLSVRDSSSISILMLSGGEVTLVEPDGTSQPIVSDLPGTASQSLVIECEVPCATPTILRNESKNLLGIDHRDEGLVLFMGSGGASIIADGQPLFEASNAVAAIAGLSPHLWSFDIAARVTETDSLLYAELAVGQDRSFWVAGKTGPNALTLAAHAGWTVPSGRSFLTRLNSEDGQVCSDR